MLYSDIITNNLADKSQTRRSTKATRTNDSYRYEYIN